MTHLQSVFGFINRETYTFKGEFTLENLHEFAFDLIPSNLVYELNAYNYNRIISNAHEEGKVLAVLVTRLDTKLSLNFQMPCLQMINNIKC